MTNKMPPSIIAIDGPAASGKSTLGLKLAKALDYLFFDTGVMYRAITWETRLPNVDANVSVVSAYAGVRAALSKQQRRIGQRGKVVMVGRDIGTVVLPEADLKIYLDASAEERAQRRFDEMSARGAKVNYEDILAKVIERDRIDSTRDVAPLKAADDAVVVDSDKMNVEEVFEQVMALCK